MVATPKSTNYILGDLCPKHEYENSGQSLRYADGRCLECRKKEYRESQRRKATEIYKIFPACAYPQIQLDLAKHALGDLCPASHDYGNGESVRFIKGGGCLECQHARHLRRTEKSFVYPRCPYPQLKFDDKKHILGLLCVNLHDFGNGQSVRTLGTYMCVQCRRDQPSVPSNKRPEKSKQRKREYSKLRNQKLKAENPDFRKEYYRANRDRINKANKGYRETPEGRAKRAIEASRRRAKKASVHTVKWSREEQGQRFSEFDNKCAYCGSEGKLTTDHFIAINQGGADCIGNVVPACGPCNFSKQSSDPKDWYSRQVFYSPTRWKHILKVLGLNNNTCNQLPLF